MGMIRSRITPACAGIRSIKPLIRSLPQDHPRMRGDKYARCWAASFSRGSPPHARG